MPTLRWLEGDSNRGERRDQGKTIVANSFSEPTLLGVRNEAAVLGVMHSRSSFWKGIEGSMRHKVIVFIA